MSSKKAITKQIDRADQMAFVLSWAKQMSEKALQAGPVLFTLSRPGKSRSQEEKYHAMIGDIHHQCFRAYTVDEVKAIMVKQFSEEMEAMGEPLRNPGSITWDWRTKEPVTVRASTKKFLKHEAIAFIEFLYASGTEFDVQWSDASLAIYDEMKEAKAA